MENSIPEHAIEFNLCPPKTCTISKNHEDVLTCDSVGYCDDAQGSNTMNIPDQSPTVFPEMNDDKAFGRKLFEQERAGPEERRETTPREVSPEEVSRASESLQGSELG